jgi:L-malate glycosyltransferase
MRICFLADAVSIHTARWCHEFTALGHEVHVISFQDGSIPDTKVHFVDAGTIKVKGGNWQTLLRVRDVRKVIKEVRPDVMHALYATSYGTIGALTGFHPFVITPLGTDILITANQSIGHRYLLQFALRKADTITSMAGHMRKKIEEFNRGKTKVEDIVFGIDTRVFNYLSNFRDKEKFTLICTRSFEPVYNIPQVIEAIALIRNKIPHLQVHMVGDGSLKKELVKSVQVKNLDDIIHFHGRLRQPEIANLLNSSHVYLSTSRSDGSSLSLLEAMISDTIPVVTDIPANREWISHKKNGLLVPVDDALKLADGINFVYENYSSFAPEAQALNRKIIEEKGSLAANTQKLLAIYEQLIHSFK